MVHPSGVFCRFSFEFNRLFSLRLQIEVSTSVLVPPSKSVHCRSMLRRSSSRMAGKNVLEGPMPVDSGGVGGGTSTSSGGSTTSPSSGSKESGKSESFGKAMNQVSDKNGGSGSASRNDDKKSSATPEPKPATTPTASPPSTPQPGTDQPKTENDRKKEDDNNPNSVVVGRSAAQARSTYVNAQTQQVRNAVKNAPLTPFDGDVFRHVGTGNYKGYNQSQYSDPGRYNRPGQSTLYTSEDMRSLKIEAGRYADLGKTGFENRTVTQSQFTGNVVDATNLPGVTEGALAEPYANGRHRTDLSKWTGENPYQHTRALSDEARAKGADAVRAPAGEGAVHIGLLPENMANPAGQFQYQNHYQVDADGVPGTVRSTPGDMAAPPPPSTPNKLDPSSPIYQANPAKAEAARATDADGLNRGGGARYGALAGFGMSGFNAVRDGELTTNDAVNVAAGTTFGASAAVVDDALTRRLGGGLSGGIKAGGIVDGVVSAGTSVYSNAGAYGRGEISAADATADVIVDTGVGVASGLTGAAAGAAIGSVIPVAGTAVGAVIGFGVGMLASWGASEALEKTGAADWAKEGLGDALEDNKEGMLESAWGTVSGWFD